MEKTEGVQIKRGISKKKNAKKKLPWWVELFFVQIGLPEKLLKFILKLQIASKEHLSSKKRFYSFLLICIAFIYYINPIIKSYQNQNDCVDELEKKLNDKDIIPKNNILMNSIIALNICKGGDLNSIN